MEIGYKWMYGRMALFSQRSIYNLTLKITVRVIQWRAIYNCGKIFSEDVTPLWQANKSKTYGNSVSV